MHVSLAEEFISRLLNSGNRLLEAGNELAISLGSYNAHPNGTDEAELVEIEAFNEASREWIGVVAEFVRDVMKRPGGGAILIRTSDDAQEGI
jgi:hypothetical protein